MVAVGVVVAHQRADAAAGDGTRGTGEEDRTDRGARRERAVTPAASGRSGGVAVEDTWEQEAAATDGSRGRTVPVAVAAVLPRAFRAESLGATRLEPPERGAPASGRGIPRSSPGAASPWCGRPGCRRR